MRDPARIDRVLAAVTERWRASPDLRLGQLLANALVAAGLAGADIFYVEDEQLLDGLHRLMWQGGDAAGRTEEVGHVLRPEGPPDPRR